MKAFHLIFAFSFVLLATTGHSADLTLHEASDAAAALALNGVQTHGAGVDLLSLLPFVGVLLVFAAAPFVRRALTR